METQNRGYGDTKTKLGMQFKQDDTDGTLAVTDLSGLTVKVLVVDERKNVVVAETTTGVTVSDAANGKVTYDFQSALPPGTYYVYGRAYDGSEYDTFPAKEEEMRVVIGWAGA